jgi:hypothetical protein
VPDNFSGQTIRCPKCKGKFSVAGGAVAARPGVNLVAASRPAHLPPPEEATARCPYCSEVILATAKKCKHCGEILDLLMREAEESKRSELVQAAPPEPYYPAPQAPAIIHVHGPTANPGTAAVLEILGGLLIHTFGIGHMYAGNVFLGLIFMFGGWVVLAVNVALCFVLIGFVTLPVCWVGMLIFSPILAASSVKGGR